MATVVSEHKAAVWKETPWVWLTMVCMAALLGYVYLEGLKQLVIVWDRREEYSYGYMIPFITLFLIWQRKDRLEKIEFRGSWLGAAVVALGLGLLILGNLSTLFLVVQLSFLVSLAGLVLAFTGRQAFKVIQVPLLILVFMIPLPSFFLQELSQVLQFYSSEIGVWVIRLFGISVNLEGNVIDLGTYQLQVVEACSGLRYLFPLMTLGFIAAYFFKAPFWKRVVVFLSTIPITVLMNSFRIGVIGITVEFWGAEMAEGFLHEFEGWAVFMMCTAVLIGEMWILSRIGREKVPLAHAFGVEFPEPTPKDALIRRRVLPKSYGAAMLLVGMALLISIAVPERTEVQPARKDFLEFPLEMGVWHGKSDRLEDVVLGALKLDDYILVNYTDGKGGVVNFYGAYYASQSKGESAHSPRTCIPGGGWEITRLTQQNVPGVMAAGQPLRVNRVEIQHGDEKQLVYYWFQERGRIISNEYLVKWFIFWDAVTKNRTDGALVRLATLVGPGENMADADRRLQSFAGIVAPELGAYVPE